MSEETRSQVAESNTEQMESQKPKPKSNRFLTIIGFVLLASFIVFGALFLKESAPYWKGNKSYKDLNKRAVSVKSVDSVDFASLGNTYIQTLSAGQPQVTNAPGMPNITPTPIPTLTANQLDLLRIQSLVEIDFEYLKELNPDIVGWIFMERENINYPVVLGPDNYYYLSRLPDRTPNRLGSIFMEHKNKPDFSDDTTVLFGHNMLDDSMFAPLEYYREQWYYDEHPSLYIFTPEATFRVDVFAGYVVEAHDIDSLHQKIHSIEEKRNFVANSIARSTFKSNVHIADDDRFVSLYTCNYDYTDSRYVVQGKLVKLTP